MSDEVKETMTDDGRIVVYSLDEDGEEPADTDQWMASNLTDSGSDKE